MRFWAAVDLWLSNAEVELMFALAATLVCVIGLWIVYRKKPWGR